MLRAGIVGLPNVGKSTVGALIRSTYHHLLGLHTADGDVLLFKFNV